MDNYNDIIFLEHPTSRKHKRMAAHLRAAQFASFAALTGLDDAANEAARINELKFLFEQSKTLKRELPEI